MTVAFDARSASGAQTGDMSFTHTPVGTPRAVIVLIVQNVGFTDELVSAPTYGGVSMTAMAGSPNSHITGETGVVYGYFLGAGIPTGAQTVAVDVNIVGSTKRAEVWTLTGADDTEIVDVDAAINSDSQANPSVTLSLAGRTCFAGIGFHSGQAAVTGITPLTGWTSRQEGDFGEQTAGFYTYDTVSTVDVTAGWTQAADDALAIAVAVSEVQAAAGHPTMRRWGGVPGMAYTGRKTW